MLLNIGIDSVASMKHHFQEIIREFLEQSKSRTLTSPNAGEGVGQQGLSFTAGGSAKAAAIMEGSSVVSDKLRVAVIIVQAPSRV